MKHFYSHIVDLDDLHRELDVLEISEHERVHLHGIIESSLHHVVMDAVLSELHDGLKETFLIHVSYDNHDAAWKLLQQSLGDPEETIRIAIDTLKEDLKEDIKALQK